MFKQRSKANGATRLVRGRVKSLRIDYDAFRYEAAFVQHSPSQYHVLL